MFKQWFELTSKELEKPWMPAWQWGEPESFEGCLDPNWG